MEGTVAAWGASEAYQFVEISGRPTEYEKQTSNTFTHDHTAAARSEWESGIRSGLRRGSARADRKRRCPGLRASVPTPARDIYRFALHMTGTAGAADDVTQDVFMVVVREAARSEPGRSRVTAWLCGIARNCARQRLDRDRPFQPLDEEDDAWRDPALQTDRLAT